MAQITVGPPGSGAAFDDLQAAIDAAPAGATVAVAAGTYGPIAITRGITILGQGPDLVTIDAPLAIGVEVRDTGPAETVLLSGFEVRASPFFAAGTPASITLGNCDGPVTLHDLRVDFEFAQTAVAAESCAQLSILDCDLLEAGTSVWPAVSIDSSVAFVANCELSGAATANGIADDGACGLLALHSTVTVWNTAIRGGDGTGGKPNAGTFAGDGAAAIAAVASTVELLGGPVGSLRGGDGAPSILFGQAGAGGSGIELDSASIARVQAALAIDGGLDGTGAVVANAVELEPGAALNAEAAILPTLRTNRTQWPIGIDGLIEIDGAPGSTQILWSAADAALALPLAGIDGSVLLDPGSAVLLTTVPLPSGATSLLLAVPAAPALLGQVLFLQSVQSDAAGIRISNPVALPVSG